MMKLIKTLVVAVCLISPVVGVHAAHSLQKQTPTQAAAKENEISILFIGNSFTFRHNLPMLVKKVFEEGNPGMTVKLESVLGGGKTMFEFSNYGFAQTTLEQATIPPEIISGRIKTMEGYLKSNEAPDKEAWTRFVKTRTYAEPRQTPPFSKLHGFIGNNIERHKTLLESVKAGDITKWDYVVLQSWQDVHPSLDEGYAKNVMTFADIAAKQGTKVILYITAPRVMNHESVEGPLDQESVDREMTLVHKLAKEIKACAVVPVPLAINMIQKNGTDLKFRYVNDAHPNQYCAFLTSNMFYAAVFKKSTEGFKYNSVRDTKVIDGKDRDGGNPAVVFDDKTKIYLQKMAFDAVMAFDKSTK